MANEPAVTYGAELMARDAAGNQIRVKVAADGSLVIAPSTDPALGVNQTAEIAKLELIRALLAGTLTVNTGNATPATSTLQTTGNASLSSITTSLTAAAGQGTTRTSQAIATDSFAFSAATSLTSAVNMAGRSVLRFNVPSGWTAADLTFQVSTDNTTFFDLFDEFGSVYTVKAAASSSISVGVGPLLGIAWLKIRSGTPTLAVSQASAVTITAVSQVL